MRKIMRKAITILVLAAFISASSPITARPVEASLVVTAAEMVALVAMVGIVWGELASLATKYGDIQETTEHIVDRGIAEQQFDTTMYGHDHRALEEDYRIDLFDVTDTLMPSYTDLAAAGGVSFARTAGSAVDGADVERFIQGRAGAQSGSAYPGEHAARANMLKNYAVGVMEGNDRDIDRLLRYKDKELKLIEAMFDGTALADLKDIWEKEFDTLYKYHDKKLPYKAADPNEFEEFDGDDGDVALETNILTGPGYRRSIQAAGQIANLKNHMMTNVRVMQARQIEADLKYAHNEQQERAELHFSFEGAVGTWNPASTSLGY